MTSGQWVIWQGITQKCPFLLWEKINLWKVGRLWSEMPPPTLRKKEKKKGSGHLGYSESHPPIFLCTHTNTYTDSATHTCKHKHTQAQKLALTQIYFLSLLHTHTCTRTQTNTYWEALERARLNVQPRCCTELMKSGCHASAWQVSLTKQIPIYMQRGRRGPCQMLMPGTL